MGFTAVAMKPARVTAGLVPWDPESPDHINRLIEQRIDCGWDKDKPDGPWKKAQLEGRKCIYWIVRRNPAKNEYLGHSGRGDG